MCSSDLMLDQAGLDEAMRPQSLSGGQRTLLSLIGAFCSEAGLLVLDEPVASLDPAGRRDFLRELVGDVMDRGATVVFSTHQDADLSHAQASVHINGTIGP